MIPLCLSLLAEYQSVPPSNPEAPDILSVVHKPTVINRHDTAYPLPSVPSICAPVFHEIAWLNLQACGCEIVCVWLYLVPNGRGTVLNKKKGGGRKVLAHSDLEAAGTNRCHFLPCCLPASTCTRRRNKPVLLEKTTRHTSACTCTFISVPQLRELPLPFKRTFFHFAVYKTTENQFDVSELSCQPEFHRAVTKNDHSLERRRK